MQNFITNARLNIQAGAHTLYSGEMSFHEGLNIVTGENGTGKTKLLQALGTPANLQASNPAAALRIQSISPKRNSQRRQFRQALHELRSKNTKIESLVTAQALNDLTFVQYPSIGDLFFVLYEKNCRDGGSQIDRMKQTVDELNQVIRSVFENYELIAEWDSSTGTPDVALKKDNAQKVPFEGLSLGETEVLSLVAYLHSSVEHYDVFLIDEPEVHLNWHLEDRLFKFLNDYCNDNKKQMVVATHSRVAFKPAFISKLQFLYWKEGTVVCSQEVTEQLRTRIAGDAIELVNFGNFANPTFFVEDDMHVQVLENIASVLNVPINVTSCKNKQNVRSMYKYSLEEDRQENAYFLEDGDNEGSPYRDERFIHLEKYCMESYLLDYETAASVSGKTMQEIEIALYRAVVANRDRILKKNKYLEFLFDKLTPSDLTPERMSKFDASEILPSFINNIEMSSRQYVEKYVKEAHQKNKLSELCPTRIVEILTSDSQDAAAKPITSS